MGISILVASKNPIKIQASLEAFQPVFEQLRVDSCEIKIDRPNADQPIGEEQTRQYSRMRVSEIRKKYPRYDYYIGIEGGIVKTLTNDSRIVVYTSIGDKDHIVTIRGCEIPLPDSWLEILTKKKYNELGDLVADVSGIKDIKRKQGAVGFFTKDNVKRIDVLRQSVFMALVPYMNPALFFN